MPRPRKDEHDRKAVDLRVPLTVDQKDRIAEAARREGLDMAAWARPILLRAAEKELEDVNRSK